MGDFKWTELVGSTTEISNAYASPPDLNECDLYYVQIDERDTSVTLAFETSTLPSNPPLAWTKSEFNTVEFFVKFTGVTGLKVSGWDSSARDAAVTLLPCGDEGLRVSVEAAGSHLEFIAAASLLTRARPYLSARASGGGAAERR